MNTSDALNEMVPLPYNEDEVFGNASYFPIEVEYIYSGDRAVVSSPDEIRDESFRIIRTRCKEVG